jgi:FAD/FMN-containing dehydrogenase
MDGEANEGPGGAATLLDMLRTIVGAVHVLTEPRDVAPYLTDWRRTFTGSALCVVRPRSTADVSTVVRLCGRAGLAVVPQGGNTGMAVGAVPDASGSQVVLSLTRMNRIRSLDPASLTVEAEAGCTLKAVQDAAKAKNRLLPINIASAGTATVGGIVSTNAGGIAAVRYGMARQMVLGLEVVLADGSVLSGLRHLRKDNAGYDWKQWFIGSEGTLGIVTGAVMRLAPKPSHVVTAMLSLPGTAAAIELLTLAQDQIGDTIEAFELMSGSSLSLVAKHFGRTLPLPPADWFVLLEAGSSFERSEAAVEALLSAALESGIALDGVVAASRAQAAELMALREMLTEGELKEGRSVKHDVSVPIAAIPAFLAAAEEAVTNNHPGARTNVFGHVGDGNMHFNVFPAGHEQHAVNRTVHDVVAAFDGSIAAEHGIGAYRVGELQRHRSKTEMDLMRRIKAVIDPAGTLNPGKVLPARRDR